jgi:hypothetical protein
MDPLEKGAHMLPLSLNVSQMLSEFLAKERERIGKKVLSSEFQQDLASEMNLLLGKAGGTSSGESLQLPSGWTVDLPVSANSAEDLWDALAALGGNSMSGRLPAADSTQEPDATLVLADPLLLQKVLARLHVPAETRNELAAETGDEGAISLRTLTDLLGRAAEASPALGESRAAVAPATVRRLLRNIRWSEGDSSLPLDWEKAAGTSEYDLERITALFSKILETAEEMPSKEADGSLQPRETAQGNAASKTEDPIPLHAEPERGTAPGLAGFAAPSETSPKDEKDRAGRSPLFEGSAPGSPDSLEHLFSPPSAEEVTTKRRESVSGNPSPDGEKKEPRRHASPPADDRSGVRTEKLQARYNPEVSTPTTENSQEGAPLPGEAIESPLERLRSWARPLLEGGPQVQELAGLSLTVTGEDASEEQAPSLDAGLQAMRAAAKAALTSEQRSGSFAQAEAGGAPSARTQQPLPQVEGVGTLGGSESRGQDAHALLRQADAAQPDVHKSDPTPSDPERKAVQGGSGRGIAFAHLQSQAFEGKDEADGQQRLPFSGSEPHSLRQPLSSTQRISTVPATPQAFESGGGDADLPTETAFVEGRPDEDAAIGLHSRPRSHAGAVEGPGGGMGRSSAFPNGENLSQGFQKEGAWARGHWNENGQNISIRQQPSEPFVFPAGSASSLQGTLSSGRMESAAPAFSFAEAQWPQDLADLVGRMSREGRHRMTLEVEPKHLGKLSLRIETHGNAVSAWIQTEHPDARDLLARNSAFLQNLLSEQGLNLSQFSVDVREHHRHPGRRAEEEPGTGNRARGTETAGPVKGPGIARYAGATGTTISLRA